jgi:hypothetical protein
LANVVVNIQYKVDSEAVRKSEERLKQAQSATDKLRKSAKDYGAAAKKAGTEASTSFADFGNVLKAVSFAVLANQLLAFTKEVIKVRGEFEKFEAVLTNTLGNKSQALLALTNIQRFAASTPFSVSQLTENFIKLANRGIKPTIDQMRAIGDLSATLGKDFGQVVEAILDINNPERWKEIGIKAETAGDKVKLSFRGVTQEVDRTIEGVTGAVVALGQLNGVAGSTEAIAGTLAGKMSNLGDAWEQFLNTLGKGNSGILSTTVDLMTRFLNTISGVNAVDLFATDLAAKVSQGATSLVDGLVRKLKELRKEAGVPLDIHTEELIEQFNLSAEKAELFRSKVQEINTTLSKQEVFAKTFNDFAKKYYGGDLQKAQKEFIDNQYQSILATQAEIESNQKLNEGVNSDQIQERINNLKEDNALRRELIQSVNEQVSATQALNNEHKNQVGIIEELEKEIKRLEQAIVKAPTKELGAQLTDELDVAKETLRLYIGQISNLPPTVDLAAKKQEGFTKQLEDTAMKGNTLNDILDTMRKKLEALGTIKTPVADQLTPSFWGELGQAMEDNKLELVNAGINNISDAIIANRDLQVQALEAELTETKDFYDEQILLAGDNERAKQELRIREERETKALRRRIANEEKEARKFAIIVDTAANVVKSILMNGGIPAGIPAGLIAAAYGATQLAIVNNAIPKFAKGVLDLQGPGTSTSDSIHARLSKGESIMTSEETRKAYGVLESVKAGKLDDRVLRDLQLSRDGVKYVGMKDDRIVAELKALKNSQPDYVAHGSLLFEVRRKGEIYRQKVRKKYMG